MHRKDELVELGVRLEKAKTSVQDACVYLRRLKRASGLAVAELVLENIRTMQSQFKSWACLEFGPGLQEAILFALRSKDT